MNYVAQSLIALVGRLLLALMFIFAGVAKIGDFAGTAGYIATQGLPLASALAAAAIVLEIGAGLALIVGFKTRAAALALAIFTLVASFIFHNFWVLPADSQTLQMLMFMKNIAVTGGLLMVVAQGAGAWSLDARGRRGSWRYN
ncbi:MAG: DoxX family protein [Burkholderiaceae bacterium]